MCINETSKSPDAKEGERLKNCEWKDTVIVIDMPPCWFAGTMLVFLSIIGWSDDGVV